VSDADDLELFKGLSAPERDARIYQMTRANGALTGETHFDIGQLTREVSRLIVTIERWITVMETVYGAALKKSKSVPPPSPRVPSMRPPLPSYLDEHESDSDVERERKAKVVALIEERDAELAVFDWWKRMGRYAIVILGLITAGAAVAAIVWAIFKFAVKGAGP
jgi:hypothetical protein